MRGFKVIDKKTGKEANPKEIALSKKWADVDTTKGSVFYQVVKKNGQFKETNIIYSIRPY